MPFRDLRVQQSFIIEQRSASKPPQVELTAPAFRLRSYGTGAHWHLLVDAGWSVHLLGGSTPDPTDGDAGLDQFVTRIGAAVDEPAGVRSRPCVSSRS